MVNFTNSNIDSKLCRAAPAGGNKIMDGDRKIWKSGREQYNIIESHLSPGRVYENTFNNVEIKNLLTFFFFFYLQEIITPNY